MNLRYLMVCLVLSLVFTGIAFSANAKKHHPRHPGIPHFRQWVCIHNGEGAWNANTGNGYYGGLQMDRSFQHTYGHRYYHRRGTANHWTPREQMLAAERAWKTRGFYPWPTTARACGLI